MTRQRTATDAEWIAAIVRSALYALLSQTVAYPTPERLTSVRSEIAPLLREARFGDGPLDAAVRALLDTADTPLAELQQAYNQLFTHIVSPDCPTHETAFSNTDAFQQAQVMADIAGFYRAHGVQVGGPERERPDHIGAELEFLRFLARKEAHARAHLGPDQVEECRRTQITFLRDHLGCWGPALGRRIAGLAASPFYRRVGTLLETWLESDMRMLAVQAIRELDQPLPPSAPEMANTPGGSAALGCDADGIAGIAGPEEPAMIEIDSIR